MEDNGKRWDNRKQGEVQKDKRNKKPGTKSKAKTKISNYHIPIQHFLENENANNLWLILMIQESLLESDAIPYESGPKINIQPSKQVISLNK